MKTTKSVFRFAVVAAVGAVLAAGSVVGGAPAAQAAGFHCEQRNIPDGWYNLCSGVPRPHQYQSQVTCALAASPQRTYLAKGAWRYYGTGNPSIATCNPGDFATGDRQLNFN